MNFLYSLLTNKIFLAPAFGWVLAQIIKFIVDSVKSGLCKERLYSGSGMPSAHSAAVTALMCITGYFYGGDSFEFVITLVVAFIVIYDARGVRYETLRQGRALNNLNEERIEEGKQPLEIRKFKEKIGHTIPEIIYGIIIGIICTIIVIVLPI